ncbi:prefoldin subunit 2-like [Dysidea avara]|uniref:prefoldin subunit 2-like n=1 Tax=Dysidea avara TaxID=196820 RepID=UPI00332CB5BC
MATNSTGKSGQNEEKVVAQFQQLRQEQRAIALKISELESEVNEHETVIETIKDVDGDRKCFRMIGGVLVERSVKEVLPALRKNREQISGLVSKLKAQLTVKGKEVNEFREKHNIKIQGEGMTEEQSNKKDTKETVQGVLV